MKKGLLAISFLFACTLVTSLWAQNTIVYDFEDGQMPEDFTLINRDGLEPNLPEDSVLLDSAWIVINSGLMESFAALSVSWYVNDDGPADDWMILPKIDLGSAPMLSWRAISTTSSGDFPDSYQVLINTEEPTFESFESNGAILLTVDPEEFAEPQNRSIDLADYAGESVHIAFRNITPSGDALLVDDITIEDGELTGIRQVLDPRSLAFRLSPNPSPGPLQVSFRLDHPQRVVLLLRNALGQTVDQHNLGLIAQGAHQLSLPIDELPSGNYWMSLQTEDGVATQPLLVAR